VIIPYQLIKETPSSILSAIILLIALFNIGHQAISSTVTNDANACSSKNIQYDERAEIHSMKWKMTTPTLQYLLAHPALQNAFGF
jgi:hypothetical protein